MNVPIGRCMAIAASICLLAGGGFTLVGVDELHEALHSSAKPVEITGDQLHTYRPGSNKHILLTRFVPYREGILAWQDERSPSWSVWVPVLPADAPKADPQHIVAVVALSGISDEDSLRLALAQPRWTGILHSHGDLGPYALNLYQLNPGINSGSCWVMWEGHRPPDPSGAMFKVIACPCLFVLGMVLAVLAALRPITAPGEVSAPSPGFPFIPASVLGGAVRWLYRRGFFSGRTAIFLAAAGLASVAEATYVWYRDWDKVVNVKNEVQLLLGVCGGLIGLALLAYAVLVSLASWRTAPTEGNERSDCLRRQSVLQ